MTDFPELVKKQIDDLEFSKGLISIWFNIDVGVIDALEIDLYDLEYSLQCMSKIELIERFCGWCTLEEMEM